MWKKIALTLLWVGIFPAEVTAHDFYISITTIRQHPETQKLTIRVKVFVNDLEESIFQEQGTRLGYWAEKPVENAQSLVDRYLSSSLLISINDIPVPLKFISLKVEPAEVLEDHVMVCELEANDVGKIRTIKVHNSLLTEAIDSQVNIINLLINDTRKVINLDRRLPEDQVTFD